MYLDPIYWIMDNSSLRLLEEEWEERKTMGGEMNGNKEKHLNRNA